MADTASSSATSPESAAVAQNLERADKTENLQGQVHATTESHGGPETHMPDPAIGGAGGYLNATTIVSIAMAVFILVLIWKKVPAVIAGVLDKQIAGIRAQLDEASNLRREAEALKAEYEGKIASANRDAEALRTRAGEEAAQAIADAKLHAAELVTRRQKMAEDKIAAAERAAIADIRARTAKAATAAAASLIAQTHDRTADASLVDQSIRGLGAPH